MKNLCLLLAALAALVGCKSNKADTEGKSLILYYSQTSTTKTVAEELQKQTGADIEAIEAVNPYDGDFEATIKRCLKEKEDGTRAEIKPLKSNIEDYDTIYIGYPIWFGTYAPPVATLLKTIDLKGKVVIPFCTFGSGGLTNTVASLKRDLKESTVLDGFGIRKARIGKLEKELTQFLINAGIKLGTPVTLPEFSEQRELTDAEGEIFKAACDDYDMPLGFPVSVGTRKIEGGTEYLYTVKQESERGLTDESRIYITVSDSIEAKPEFTLVER